MNQLFPGVFKTYNLLSHPFYQAWNEGRLTRQQLTLYAEEYANFIGLVSEGWQMAGEPAIAAEEQEHFILWKKFSASLGGINREAAVSEMKLLARCSKKNFETYAGALGALYAFEAQQPGTASAKLKGLRDHYSGWQVDENYFKVHENDLAEPALLEGKINALNDSGKMIAAIACEETCYKLWNALTGIMNHSCEN